VAEASSITEATLLRASGDVLSRTAGDETVLLDLGSEEFFGLDGAGARLFELLEQPQKFAKILDSLHGEYDVDRETLRADVTDLVIELIERGLVVVDA
jgi:hypothetical protein